MLGFGHQTVFGLCIALLFLAGVSVVCIALLLFERQDLNLLQQNVSSLRQENTRLKSQLDDYRNGLLPRQKAPLQSSE